MIFFHPESYPSTLNDSNKWVFQVARLIPRLFHKMPLWYINGANLKGYPSHWDLGLGPCLNRSCCTGNPSSICQFSGAAGSVMGDFTRLLWSVIWYYRTHMGHIGWQYLSDRNCKAQAWKLVAAPLRSKHIITRTLLDGEISEGQHLPLVSFKT